MKVDLNSDLGEGAGHDDEILSLVSSANIACGFHAGNPASIFNSIRAAKEKGVAVGAHPSLNDRKNFGRTEMQISAAEVYALVAYQVGAFKALCAAAGVDMNHVKPHGALYNMAVRDRELSDAIAHGVLAVDTRALLFAPAGTELFRAAHELGLQPAAEVFADRNYNSGGARPANVEGRKNSRCGRNRHFGSGRNHLPPWRYPGRGRIRANIAGATGKRRNYHRRARKKLEDM
jgi:UPF0271 protein